jgi:hypothetical protein
MSIRYVASILYNRRYTNCLSSWSFSETVKSTREESDHPLRYTLSSMTSKHAHPILTSPSIQPNTIKKRQEVSGNIGSVGHSQTETLTIKMREMMELVEFYEKALKINTKRIKEFAGFLESYRLGEEGSPEGTDTRSHYVKELRKSFRAIRALVTSTRRTRTRDRAQSKNRDISARLQWCKCQLSSLNSEASEQIFNRIRQMQKPLEVMRCKKANPEKWTFFQVEDGFCLNTRFIRSLGDLLEALDNHVKFRIEFDKDLGVLICPSQCIRPITDEYVIQYGEKLSSFSERFIKLAQEIQTIANETASQELDLINPMSSTPFSAFARSSGAYQ